LFPKIILAFAIFTVISVIPGAFADSISVDIEDSTYEIDFTSIDVEIKSVSADTDFISLIFEIDVLSKNGQLEFNFDRNFFDAKLGSEDDDFFVLVDGDELSFEESKDDFYRNIVFSVDPGSEEIEIIGSQIVGISYLLEKEAEIQIQIEVEEQAIEEQEAEIISKLQEQCGEGTILEDGVCVLANESVPINVTPLFLGFGIAFGIAITAVLILWGFGKISNKELPEESN
jgi:hypothetical protein|tara:strand:+ start:66 stop:755 length:690 start_codon:yes stop_codon:yes gene_type:complete